MGQWITRGRISENKNCDWLFLSALRISNIDLKSLIKCFRCSKRKFVFFKWRRLESRAGFYTDIDKGFIGKYRCGWIFYYLFELTNGCLFFYYIFSFW